MSNAAKGGQRRRYPSLNLEQAIERADVLYQAERMNPAPIEVITDHWGFSSRKTGPASTTYSAVKQFGLIEESGAPGQRKARITARARAILTAPDAVRQDAIREAALEPPMNRLIWDRMRSDTGSDASFRWMLVDELGFSDTGAREFAKQYRATVQYAGLDSLPDLSEGDYDDEPSAELDDPTSQDTTARTPVGVTRVVPASNAEGSLPAAVEERSIRMTRHAIPLLGGKQVILEGEFPVSEAAWEGFMAVLQAFKPGLVMPDAPGRESEGDV